MISKSSFDWQANTSESRKFWEENSGKFYWRLLADNSYKLIDLFVNISGMEISGLEISERFSIPKRTVEWHISQLKQHRIVFSEKHIYPINGNTRSMAHYAVIFSGLVSLSNHLQNLNIKEWNRSDDPFRSIMKRKNEIPANPYGSTSPQWRSDENKNQLSTECKHSFMENQNKIPANPHGGTSAQRLNDENKNQLSGDSCHCGHLKIMKLIYLEHLPTEDDTPFREPLPRFPSGEGILKTLSGEDWRIHVFDHDENKPTCQKIPAGSFPAAPDRNKKMENSLQKPQGGSIMNSFEQIAKNDQLEDKHFEKNFPNETSNNVQIAKKGEFASSRPRPRLFVKVNDHGHASRMRQDASRGTKMKKTTLDMGFIKNELRIDSKQETRNVPNSGYEKFVDYWNDLADDGLRIPKCTKVRAGAPTKVFEKALQFFKEFQNGKLFANSRKFVFTNSYLNNLGVRNLGVPPFSDNYLFQIIKQVANLYHDNSHKFAPRFDTLLYSGFTAKAQAAHEYQSGFLELACMSFGKNLTLDSILDKLPNEERDILYQVLIPMYQDLRKVNSDPTNDEMFQLINGMKGMKHLWDSQYERQCTNSYQAKIGRIPATFYWFVDTYSDWVRDIKWNDIPLSMIFSQQKKYLSEYLNFLDEEL